ncbi:MAG: YidC/Oxa1 family membrane protein insertase [Patescibacteria group bacterium]|nr:YidC/Oxa1 family membrane protein insertase [Patescibacteria group bacterium]
MINFFKIVLYNPLYNLLIFLAWLVPGHSIGWAIIILTVIIRLLLWSNSIKAARAQVKMQAIQPEINRLRKEIKDQQEQGKALMALYKKEGVSPFGSCLPLLIQMPIIIVLYQVFRAGVDQSNFSLLYSFVPHPEKINAFFLGFNLAKPDLWILPILAGVTQFILSYLMQPKVATQSKVDIKSGDFDPMQMANKQMVYFFPLITVFFARSLPSALSIYWIVTTLFGIIQQLYVNKHIRKEKFVEASIEEAKEAVDEIEKGIEAPKKKDYLSRMMEKRLDKQEKKSGVEITIRKK